MVTGAKGKGSGEEKMGLLAGGGKQKQREENGKQIKERTAIKNAELKMFQMASDI